MEKLLKRIIIGSIAGVLFLILLFASLTSVPVGSTGVVKRMGTVTGNTLSEGIHFKVPFIESVVDINNKVVKLDVEAASTSKDLQTINSTVSINYHLAAESSSRMYQNVGKEFEDTLLSPAMQEAVKNVMAKYSAEELITNRSVVGTTIKDEITAKVEEYGIIIDKFNIVNFNFTDEFNKAIEAKQVAEQNKIKANTENEQKIALAEADAKEKTIKAQADADAIKIKAEADADAIKIKADAEAEANKKLNDSLTENVLQYNKTEKWNGEYPSVISGSDDNNLLIDVNK